VVVGERVVDIRDIEVVPLCDRLGSQAALVDPGVDSSDRDAAPLNIRLVVNLTDNAGGLLGHLYHDRHTAYLETTAHFNHRIRGYSQSTVSRSRRCGLGVWVPR